MEKQTLEKRTQPDRRYAFVPDRRVRNNGIRPHPIINYPTILARVENCWQAEDFEHETAMIYWIINTAAIGGFLDEQQRAYLSRTLSDRVGEYADMRGLQKRNEDNQHRNKMKSLLDGYTPSMS